MAKTALRRRWPIYLGTALSAAAVAFFVLAPGILERSMNRIEGSGEWTVSPQAQKLHDRLVVADLHSDTLLWKRDIEARSERGHVDLPRLRDGNVKLQVFSSVTKSPRGQNYESNSDDTDNITLLAIAQLQPPRTWGSLLERSLWHAEKMRRAKGFRLVRTAADLEALLDDPQATGALLSTEGAQNLEGKLENLDVLFDAGFRMIGLAHFFDNEVAGSVHGIDKGGLTPLGREVIRHMEAKGMIVDLAHASHRSIAEALRIVTKPVVYSHGGVKATCDTNRNLTDSEIRGIAATGGIIGIGYWDAAVCAATPLAAALAMRHVRDLVGIDHVALGSDYDGSTTVGFDTSKLAAVTQALLDQGFSETDIEKTMGGNVIRVMRATLPR